MSKPESEKKVPGDHGSGGPKGLPEGRWRNAKQRLVPDWGNATDKTCDHCSRAAARCHRAGTDRDGKNFAAEDIVTCPWDRAEDLVYPVYEYYCSNCWALGGPGPSAVPAAAVPAAVPAAP
jgi:hypothetical protein